MICLGADRCLTFRRVILPLQTGRVRHGGKVVYCIGASRGFGLPDGRVREVRNSSRGGECSDLERRRDDRRVQNEFNFFDVRFSRSASFLYVCSDFYGIQLNRKLAKGLLNALSFLHSLDIIHGDVELGNIICTAPLTSDNWEVKLMDFGYGSMLDPEPQYQTVKDLNVQQDSWYYVAPEQLKREVNSSIDVWALGICLFHMFYRKYPFQ